ncbi:TRAF-interacting protein with FHA domain-containing protein A [Acipenser ruthenus]|uniref:TRAF-interacting protein with FHA domain-containing protein A n=1 Tax=Acipenser ruthenus TaxID=7906 RepID=A0A444TY59_ACIRT|nr:TRAF-interacting protein with FHA domain-containing protein A [Acipenser ruthenus]
MHNIDDVETEETLTCLRITVHHPLHEIKNVFQLIHFNKREKHMVEDPLKVGRDTKSCHISLYDLRVSRVQFSIQAFRHFNSSKLFFEIKNLSKKGKLIVNNTELEHLNKVELPKKALVRFAEFQLLVEKEDGESTESFDTFFELVRTPPCQEILCAPSMSPIPETGILINACTVPQQCSLQTPVEMEECELK